MARKKSSLDMDEPILVEDDITVEPMAVTNEPVIVKAEEPAPVQKEAEKAETQQNKTVEKTKKRGVKICVI